MTQRHKIIPAVYLILAREDGKVLLQRRFNTGHRDGQYSLVSGHLEGGESLRRALVREAKEEAGIELQEENLLLVHVMNKASDDGERIDFYFLAESWQGEPTIMEPNKCDDLQWAALHELPANMVDYIQVMFERWQSGKIYSEWAWESNRST